MVGLSAVSAQAQLLPGTSIETGATIDQLSALFNPPLDADSQTVTYPALSASASASTSDATADASGSFDAPDYEARPYASATSADADRRVSSSATMTTRSRWIHSGARPAGSLSPMTLEFQYDGSLIFDAAETDPGFGTAGAELELRIDFTGPPRIGSPTDFVVDAFYQDGGTFGVKPGETAASFDNFGGMIGVTLNDGFELVPVASTVTDILDGSGAVIGKHVNLAGSATFQSFIGAIYDVEFRAGAFTLGSGRFDLAEADFASTASFQLTNEDGQPLQRIAIPEPTSAALIGLIGLTLAGRRRAGN
jgi:hypothetical protein